MGAQYFIFLSRERNGDGNLNINESKRTVFIVDDDASIRKSLERLLRSSGFEVVAFSSAEEYLGNVPVAGPSCLVLDVWLPGLDGFALKVELDSLGFFIPIIKDSG